MNFKTLRNLFLLVGAPVVAALVIVACGGSKAHDPALVGKWLIEASSLADGSTLRVEIVLSNDGTYKGTAMKTLGGKTDLVVKTGSYHTHDGKIVTKATGEPEDEAEYALSGDKLTIKNIGVFTRQK